MVIITGIKANGEKFSRKFKRNLQELNLENHQLASIDLSSLIECTKLQKLWLHTNQLVSIDLTSLKGCTELQVLALDTNHLVSIDLSPLRGCTKLQLLGLCENQLASIDLFPLKTCAELRWVNLRENLLTSIDLSPLKTCTKLQKLDLSLNQLSSIDLSPLKTCNELQELDLNLNQLKELDVTALKNCTKVEINYKTSMDKEIPKDLEQTKKEIIQLVAEFRTDIPIIITRFTQLLKITENEIITLIKSLLDEGKITGEFLQLENVFIKKTDDKLLIGSNKYSNCYYCGHPLEREEQICPDCNNEQIICSVCKLPVVFGDDVGSCSLCEAKGHLIHLQEWIKTQGKCPVCLQSLPLEGIVPEEVNRTKKK